MKCCNRVLLGVLAAVVALMCGCGSRKANSPEDARLKDNVYTNRFFGFRVQIPDTWTVLKKPSVREMRKSAEALTGGDKAATAATLKSIARVHSLLLARNVVAGMSITVTAENLSQTPEVGTTQEYVDHALELLAGDGKPLQVVNEPRPVQFVGREFYRVDLTGGIMGVRLNQAMFVTVEKAHALVFVLTAKSESAVEEALAKVGLAEDVPQIANKSKTTRTVAARTPAKRQAGKREQASAVARDLHGESGDPPWVSAIRLQGIGGTAGRKLAIINGKTLGPGDGTQVRTAGKVIIVRCVAISEKSATVTIEGIEGERELRLN